MNVSFELIIPPVILGILTIMILNMNRVIITSSTENRITYELQNRVNLTLDILEYELRPAKSDEMTISADSTRLTFVTINDDTVSITRDEREMIITKTSLAGITEQQEYPVKLSSLVFYRELSTPFLLNVRVISRSELEEEAGTNENQARYAAIAEKEFYIRNPHFLNNIGG